LVTPFDVTKASQRISVDADTREVARIPDWPLDTERPGKSAAPNATFEFR
jgi:hypothetical protein